MAHAVVATIVAVVIRIVAVCRNVRAIITALVVINFGEVECYDGLRSILVSASLFSPNMSVLCSFGQSNAAGVPSDLVLVKVRVVTRFARTGHHSLAGETLGYHVA